MKLSYLVFIILSLIICGVNGFSFTEKKKKGRDIADIPNPKTNPVECGRELVPHSSICDPDKLLTKDIKDEMEGYLNAMKEVEIAVVIVNRMDVNGVTNKVSGTEKKAEIFARTLHDTWGVGDKETNKGVVLFLSVYDRVIYFSTGTGIAQTLDSRVIESLISGMRQYLRRGDYGTAIIHTLIEMDLLITRKIKATYGGRVRENVSSNPSEGGGDSPGETFFAFGVLAVFIGFAFYINRSQNNRIRGFERGRQQLDKLMKEVDQIKDHKYACTSCPICLEDFPTPFVPMTTSTFPQEPVPTTAIVDDQIADSIVSTSPSSTPLEEETTKEKKSDEGLNKPLVAEPVLSEEPLSTGATSTIPSSDTTSPTSNDPEKKAMALKCGHVFCRGCLEEYLSKPDGTKCPICRADIDDDPSNPNQGNTTNTNNNNNLRTPRNRRRGFFPFQRTNHIGTLWNYESTAGTGGTGIQYNPGTGTYTQTQTFHHYAPELRYRLYRMHHYYPDAVTMEVLRSMNSAIDRGAVDELRNHVVNRGVELNRMVTEIRQASQQSSRNSGMRGSSSSSFSGGRSSGGSGGRW
mmetsp:Transcript_7200/g.7885  ORF Transcript_7200/g.7885 Transcript_7200/m.7885 type:complete len:576 (+) Transcript_7200:81-1808(+)